MTVMVRAGELRVGDVVVTDLGRAEVDELQDVRGNKWLLVTAGDRIGIFHRDEEVEVVLEDEGEAT